MPCQNVMFTVSVAPSSAEGSQGGRSASGAALVDGASVDEPPSLVDGASVEPLSTMDPPPPPQAVAAIAMMTNPVIDRRMLREWMFMSTFHCSGGETAHQLSLKNHEDHKYGYRRDDRSGHHEVRLVEIG